jgi:hypothetical protein
VVLNEVYPEPGKAELSAIQAKGGLLLPHRRGQGAGLAGLSARLPWRHSLLRLLFAGEGKGWIV